MRLVQPVCVGVLLGVFAILGGCASERAQLDLGPQLDAEGRYRSVVLPTALLNHLERQAYRSGKATPWYVDRNDHRLAASAGYRLPSVQTSVTLTYDRQQQFNGRPRDHYSETTYRSETRGLVR